MRSFCFIFTEDLKKKNPPSCIYKYTHVEQNSSGSTTGIGNRYS